jgi:hypothetical protein
VQYGKPNTSSTAGYSKAGQPLVTGEGWPEQLTEFWPPYMCANCWAMKFYYNLYMAQCSYCEHIILNWGPRNDKRTVAPTS